jgi:hypothetical protein
VGFLYSIQLFLGTYSCAIRKAKALARGPKKLAKTLKAKSRYKYTEKGIFVEAASTARVPKMRMGISSGRIMREIRAPALWSPSDRAAPIEPKKLKTGVPMRRVSMRVLMANGERSN